MQKNDKSLGGHESHGGRSDLGTAASPQLSHVAHTATPWKLNAKYVRDEDCIYIESENADRSIGQTSAVATVFNDGDNAAANAAFIVRACNAHGDLVKALKSVAEDRHACAVMKMRALAAIAKAEGRS